MKVLFSPDYRKANPYQRFLAHSLSKKEVSVHFGMTCYLFSVLRSAKRHWKPDIVHIHWLHPFLSGTSRVETILRSSSFICELLILRILRVKIVWTVHNIVSHEVRFRSLEIFFTKLLTRLCNKIIVHCPSSKDEVVKTYGVRESLVESIRHGNYIDYYENVTNKSQARKQLHLRMEDMVFLYFGQIRPYKGVSELVEAFKMLDDSRVRLLIVGLPLNNEVANNLVRKCSRDKRIRTVFRFIPNYEIQIYMNAADVVVLPYRYILTSGSVILAMSFAKPVIAPAIGCIPDMIEIEGSFLYNPSETGGLTRAMEQSLNVDLKKMGQRNFDLAKNLTWDEIAKKTYNIYRECSMSVNS